MSYQTLIDESLVYASLNEDLGDFTVLNGVEGYREGGPFGQQMFDFSNHILTAAGTVNGAGTVAMWCYSDGNSTGKLQYHGQRMDVQRRSNWVMRFTIYDGSAFVFIETDASSFPPDTLIHFVGTIAADGTMKTWINGVQQAATAASNGVANAADLRVGSHIGPAISFDGGIGEYILLGRGASQADVDALYAGPQQASAAIARSTHADDFRDLLMA